MESMMGQREGGQGQFFYVFDLDKVVPPDHLIRQIDAVLDLAMRGAGSGLGYHFSMLVGGQYVARGSLRKRFGVTAQ
jgi:hypothetical protein